MSHNITERDGFFTVREPAWHGLGNVLDHYPTRAEAKAIAHPWEPEEEPIFRRVLTVGPEGYPVEEYLPVDTHKLVLRDDLHEPIGVTSSTLELVSNEALYDIMEVLQGNSSDVLFETGGSLKGGAKVWLMLKLAEPIVVKGDLNGATLPYFVLQNSHDGSGSFRGQATVTRIVCDNTAQMADLEASRRGTQFTFRHTANVAAKIEEAKVALAGWRTSIEHFQALTQELLDHKVSTTGVVSFIDQFLPMPDPQVASERVRNNVREAQQRFTGYLNGPTCEGIGGTAHALVQASIEYLNHGRKAHSDESRFRRSYLDQDPIVTHARKLALQVR